MASKPFILFITGTSASGKTTIYELLKKDAQLQPIAFHDIDERGVPPVGRDPWRRFRVEELLYQAIHNLEQGHSTIICGIIKPHEVIESRYYKQRYNVHFLLVRTPFKVVRERLQQRVKLQTKKASYDESFSKSSWGELIRGNKELDRVLSHSIANQKKGHVINAAKLSPAAMYEKVTTLIYHISNLPQGTKT